MQIFGMKTEMGLGIEINSASLGMLSIVLYKQRNI